MKMIEGSIVARDGVELQWTGWLPARGRARAKIMVIHGFGEHVGRYKNVVSQLVPRGIAVMGCDLRGHGRSQGQRGHVDQFEQFVADNADFYKEIVAETAAGKPLFVLGHSMGSIIAMHYALAGNEMDGLVLSGIGAGSPLDSPVKNALGRLLSAVSPRKEMDFPLSPEFISRDEDVVEEYKKDPLVHNRVSFRLAAELGRAHKQAVSALDKITNPTLVQCGGDDSSFTGQQKLYQRLASDDKKLCVYPCLRHEVYNELPSDREKVLSDLSEWLEEHIQ